MGTRVVATDGDDDILTYTLGGTDAAHFDIDWDTGQLRTKGELDFEDETNPDNEYEVTVRATDPDGMPGATDAVDTNSDTVMVTITVTDVDEAPDVTGDATATFEENADVTQMIETYQADDPGDCC